MRLISGAAIAALTLTSGCAVGVLDQYRQTITVDGRPYDAICSLTDSLGDEPGNHSLFCRVRVGTQTAQCEIIDIPITDGDPASRRASRQQVTDACRAAVVRAYARDRARDSGGGGYSPPSY